MLALSGFHALRDAIASVVDQRVAPRLSAPATPERVLNAIEEIRSRDPALRDATDGIESAVEHGAVALRTA